MHGLLPMLSTNVPVHGRRHAQPIPAASNAAISCSIFSGLAVVLLDQIGNGALQGDSVAHSATPPAVGFSYSQS
jgi:hypothetical protein